MFAKRRLPILHGTPTEDMLIGMVTQLASEIAVLRDRLDTTERLLEQAGVVTQGGIEGFVPDAAQTAEREKLRLNLIGRVFRPMREAARGEVA